MILKTFEKVTLQQKFYFDTLKNQIAILKYTHFATVMYGFTR